MDIRDELALSKGDSVAKPPSSNVSDKSVVRDSPRKKWVTKSDAEAKKMSEKDAESKELIDLAKEFNKLPRLEKMNIIVEAIKNREKREVIPEKTEKLAVDPVEAIIS